MKFLFHLLLLTTLSALAGASWVAHRPTLPPPVEPRKEAPKVRDRDLVDFMKQTVVKGAPIEVSEGELNRHLAKVLGARMQPALGSTLAFERVAVDLEPEKARITFVWRVLGFPVTARVDLSITRLEKTFRAEIVSGAYGHLEVPRGLLRPLGPAFRGLAAALQEEVQAIFQMNQVRISQDKLLLDPRFP